MPAEVKETMVANQITEQYVAELPVDHRDHFTISQRVQAHVALEERHKAARADGVRKAEDYGVYLVSGLRRSGKTLWATALAEHYYNQGRVVFSNLGLLFGYRVSALDLYRLAVSLPAGCVIIVDEIHTLLNRYAMTTIRQRSLNSALAGAGKRELLIVGISQQEKAVDYDFKGELDGLISVRPRRRTQPVYPPWAWVELMTYGPRPFQGGFTAEDLGFELSLQKRKKRIHRPNPAVLYEAGKLQYSWADVPFGKVAGATISGSEMHAALEDPAQIVFDDDGEYQEPQADQEEDRGRVLLSLTVQMLEQLADQGRKLSQPSYHADNLVTMVNEFWVHALEAGGTEPFGEEEARKVYRRQFNATPQNQVRIANMVERYPDHLRGLCVAADGGRLRVTAVMLLFNQPPHLSGHRPLILVADFPQLLVLFFANCNLNDFPLHNPFQSPVFCYSTA